MVYRGGLENRFGLTANGGSNPSLSATPNWIGAAPETRTPACIEPAVRWPGEQESEFVNNWINIGIWALVIGGLFGFLWWQGQIQRLALFVAETREELKKCTWPTWDELKGSTALIIIMTAMLGLFVYVIDRALAGVFFHI